MSVGTSRERSLLSGNDLERVSSSHYPALVGAERDELVELALTPAASEEEEPPLETAAGG
jgi:hypothetical protein